MAIAADQYLIELESNISKVTSREEAALKRLDQTIGRTAAEVARLEKELGGASEALQRATAGRNGLVDVNEVRRAQKEVAKLQGALEKRRGDLSTLQGGRESVAQQAAAAKEAAARMALEKQAAAASKAADKQAAEQSRVAKREAKERERAEKDRARESEKESKKGLEAYKAQQSQYTQAFDGIKGHALAATVAVVAFVAAISAVVYFGLAAAGAARDARILADALTGTEAGGKELVAVVSQLARQIPLAKDKIAEMAKELSLAKLGGRDLQATLTAMGIVASVVGDGAAASIKGIAEASRAARRFTLGPRDLFGEFVSLSGTGLKKADILGALAKELNASIPAVEKRLLEGSIALDKGLLALERATKTRFGKAVSAQMLSLPTQIAKAKEALSGMFAGVNIEPALKGIESFLSILDTSTMTGRDLQTILRGAMKGFVEAFAVAGPIAKAFFQGMIIAGLKLYIALKPVYNSIKETFGFKPSDDLVVAAKAGETAFYALAAAAAVVGISLAIAFLPFVVLGGAVAVVIAALYGAFMLASDGVSFLYESFSNAWDFISALDFVQLGADIIDGIVTGITAGAGRVFEKLKALGSDMIKVFRDAIDSHSPSVAFRLAGRDASKGAELGVDDGAEGVESAVADLGAARPSLSGAAPQGGGGGGSRSITVHIDNVNIGGSPASPDEEAKVRGWFTRIIDEAVEALGTPPEPEAT